MGLASGLTVYLDRACCGHVSRGGYFHPETPERIQAIEDALAGDLELAALPRMGPASINLDDALSCHSLAFVNRLSKACQEADQWLDSDTYAGPGSLEAALASAGLAAAAADSAAAGTGIGFSLGRPPGHHATRDRQMGFCLINNVALATQRLLDRGVARVAIVDYDVHHGNGTQDIFYDSSRVLYISLHQWPLYPGTGRVSERGVGEGEGLTMNLPLAAGSGDEIYRGCFTKIVLPALEAYHPEVIMVSSGFDAHLADPLANMCVTEMGFAWMAKMLVEASLQISAGRIAFILEGGYSGRHLGSSVAAVLKAIHHPGRSRAGSEPGAE